MPLLRNLLLLLLCVAAPCCDQRSKTQHPSTTAPAGIPSITAPACCHAANEATLFTALNTDPATVGAALARAASKVAAQSPPFQATLQPDPYPLVVLPTSESERETLLKELAAKQDFSNPPRQRETAALLLEGWGRADEALALLEKDGDDIDPLHLTRLRYRTGDRDGAAAAFAKAWENPDVSRYSYPALSRRTVVLTRPFEALGKLDDLAGFLAWLQPQCKSANLAFEILQLRLNTAYHQGKVEALLDHLAAEPAPLRDLARWSLTGDPAVLPARMNEMPVPFLLQFHRVSPASPTLNRLLESAIGEGWGDATDHAAVLRYLIIEPSVENDRLLALCLKQDDRALAALDAVLPRRIPGVSGLASSRTGIEIRALADRHPGHATANLLTARTLLSSEFPQVSPPDAATQATAIPYLLRVLRQPLAADAVKEGLSTQTVPNKRPDLPGMALEQLAALMPPAKLLENLTGHPDFAKLPAPDRARYLALAKLDVPFTDALLALDWKDPSNDASGGWPAAYLVPLLNQRRPTGELLTRLHQALPAILAGSDQKAADRIVEQANATRDLFPADTGFKKLLASLADLLDADRKREIDTLAANLKPRPKSPAVMTQPEDETLKALAFFSPPSLPRLVDGGFGHEAFSLMSSNSGTYGLFNILSARFAALGSNYLPDIVPGLENIPAPTRNRLWKLRPLLPADSPHATLVDLLITAPQLDNVVSCPKELTDTAVSHVKSWLKQTPGPDIVICRQVEAMPRLQLPDWSGLADLADAPFGARRQIAAALRSFFGSRNEGEMAAIRARLLGEAATPLAAQAGDENTSGRSTDCFDPPPSEEAAVAWAALERGGPNALLAALEARPPDDADTLAEVMLDSRFSRAMPHTAAERILKLLESHTAACGGKIPAVLRLQRCRYPLPTYELHMYFEENRPDLADRLRHLLFASGWFYEDLLLQSLVDHLRKDPARQPVAVELLANAAAGRLSSQTAAPPLRFPPAPFVLTSSGRTAFHVAVYSDLCQQTLDRLAADPTLTVPPDLTALFRYGAKPTIASFREHLLPLLDGWPTTRTNLTEILSPIPKAREHLLMASETVESAGGFSDDSSSSASRPAEWNAATLAAVWNRFKDTGATHSGRKSPPPALVSELALPMIRMAGDALWDEFLPILTKHLVWPDDYLAKRHWLRQMALSGHPERVRAVLRCLPLEEFDEEIGEILQTAWLMEDDTTLKAVTERLKDTKPNPAFRKMVGLLGEKGQDPETIAPVCTVLPGPDGKPTLYWSLSTEKWQFPVTPIAGFDGKYDLKISFDTLRAHPDARPVTLKGIPETGSHTLDPPPQCSDVTLDVIRAADGKIINNPRFDLGPDRSLPLPLDPAPAGDAGPAPRQLAAPFPTLPPPRGWFVPDASDVKLASIPWRTGQDLRISGWAANLGSPCIMVSTFDADGNPVANDCGSIAAPQGVAMWHYFSEDCPAKRLAGAARVELHAQLSGTEGPGGALWLTGLRFLTSDLSSAGLPPAATPVSPTPIFATAMTCTPDGKYLAIATRDQRVVIMEAATGTSGEFKLPRTEITALAIGGKRVIAVDRSGTLSLMDLESSSIRSLGALDATPPRNFFYFQRLRTALTPDGEWLVWTDHRREVRVVKIEDGEMGRKLTIPVGDKARFTMDYSGGALVAWGSAGYFRIPFADFASLDPARIEPQPAFPEPRGAYHGYPENPSFPDEDQFPVSWKIPRFGLTVQADNQFRIDPDKCLVTIPAAGNLLIFPLTVSPDGIIFFVPESGILHQLNAADLMPLKTIGR